MFSSRSLVLIAAIAASLALSPSAIASCMILLPLEKTLEDAPIVFVGTAVETKHDGRVATFEVEEVWKGSVEPRAVVNGGPGIREMEAAEENGQVAANSVDRAYEAGVRYLVVPFGARGKVLTDNACSSTQPYTAKLASHAPPGATSPGEEGGAQAAPPGASRAAADVGGGYLWWIALGILGIAALVALAARRFRERVGSA